MTDYSQAARRWAEPLLDLRAGGSVMLRFLGPNADLAADLGIVPLAADGYFDYPAPSSYVRELAAEELATTAGQLRQGARQVILSDAFALSVSAAQGHADTREMFEAAAGLVMSGQICRIVSFKTMTCGDEVFAWELLCDAPLEAD